MRYSRNSDADPIPPDRPYQRRDPYEDQPRRPAPERRSPNAYRPDSDQSNAYRPDPDADDPRDRNLPVYVPRVPLERRIAATAIDAVAIALFSTLLGPAAQPILFLLLWWVMRVLVVVNNRGQSLGRLAMDIKILDERSRRVPTVLDLSKREGALGIAFWLAFWSLGPLANANPTGLLTITPVAVDLAVLALDNERRQAVHDRLGNTILTQTRRGFSLDIKVKRWVDQGIRLMRK